MDIPTISFAIGAIDALLMPFILIYIKRTLDRFDAKREEARVEERTRAEKRARLERENSDEQRSIAKGVRSLLRSELIHEHRKWMDVGSCPLESKEYVQHTYDAYHGLGGNDIGTSMYQDIMGLPTKEQGA